MAEGIAGMSVLQATGAAARFAERFARTNDAHYTARLGELRANAWLLRPALDFVNILLIVADRRGDRHAADAGRGSRAAVRVHQPTSRAWSSR